MEDHILFFVSLPKHSDERGLWFHMSEPEALDSAGSLISIVLAAGHRRMHAHR